MNAILMAIIATVLPFLDYCWPEVKDRVHEKHRSKLFFGVVGGLILAVWVAAWTQWSNERQASREMAKLRLTLDRDTRPAVRVSFPDDTNIVPIMLMPQGEYPLRSLFDRGTDQTARIRRYGPLAPKRTLPKMAIFGKDPSITQSELNPPVRIRFLSAQVSCLRGGDWYDCHNDEAICNR